MGPAVAKRSRRYFSLMAAVVAIILAVGLATWIRARSAHHTSSAGPPWVYGRPDARFTVIEYADLECPYCRAYFPVLRRWVDSTPDVNWRWHHLPLSVHEPAAIEGARLAECAGEVGGNAAFWRSVDWIYQHTRGEGQGLPPDARLPEESRAIRACLDRHGPDARIRAEAEAAVHDEIAATPTLRLIDHRTGKSLILSGPVEADALASAADFLASSKDD